MEGHRGRFMGEPTVSAMGLRRVGLLVLLRRAWAFDVALTLVGVLMLLTLAVTVAGVLLDPRAITGAPAWLKPAKFAVSISIYTFTFLWLLTYVRGRRRLVKLVAGVTAVALATEEAIIVGQVVRGTTSHFNVGTPLDGALWRAMGILVVLVFVANLVVAVLLLIQNFPDPAFAWALRLGVFVSLVGMGLAFLMTLPTSAQIAAAEAGGEMPIAGAHSVGVEDGGPGLPVVGWSTTGGDLRVAHFAGLHALQAMPLVGFLVAGLWAGRLGVRHRVALVWTAGLAYLGLVLLLAWQALRGQPLIAPDAATLAALAAICVAGVGSAVAVMLHARGVGEIQVRQEMSDRSSTHQERKVRIWR